MNNDKATYVTREQVLGLLSDEEITRVSTAETAPGLADGAEYLDLENLDQGVRRAGGGTATPTPMGRVLPRAAVRDATWGAILKKLGTPVVH